MSNTPIYSHFCSPSLQQPPAGACHCGTIVIMCNILICFSYMISAHGVKDHILVFSHHRITVISHSALMCRGSKDFEGERGRAINLNVGDQRRLHRGTVGLKIKKSEAFYIYCRVHVYSTISVPLL